MLDDSILPPDLGGLGEVSVILPEEGMIPPTTPIPGRPSEIGLPIPQISSTSSLAPLLPKFIPGITNALLLPDQLKGPAWPGLLRRRPSASRPSVARSGSA
jgi:hypothetical protein